MVVNVSSAILTNVLKTHGDPMMCMPFPLSTIYYGYFIIVFGSGGALAKVKEGAKRRIEVKRESLLTSTSWGLIPSQCSRMYVPVLYYDKVALIPNGHLCHI